jgi:hypothetical protein
MNLSPDLEKLLDRSIYYRGVILHNAIILEKQIESHIMVFFCNDIQRQLDLLKIVISNMSLDAKISCFQEILKSKNPDVDFDKTFGKLLFEIRFVKDVRNRFAHHAVNLAYTKSDKIPKEFSLVNHQKSFDPKPFTKGDFEQFDKRVKRCVEELNKLPY